MAKPRRTTTDPADVTGNAPADGPRDEDYERLTDEEKARYDAAQAQKTVAQEAVEKGRSTGA